MFICRQKINYTLHVFLEILQRYCKLVVWVLWACLDTHALSDTINLQKSFVFICRQKIKFILHAFLDILQRYANLQKASISAFKYSNYLPLCQKSEKTNQSFLRKMLNIQTNRHMDRQTDNSDFIGPSTGEGFKILYNNPSIEIFKPYD